MAPQALVRETYIDDLTRVCSVRKIGDTIEAIDNKCLAAVVVISRIIIGKAFGSFVISG